MFQRLNFLKDTMDTLFALVPRKSHCRDLVIVVATASEYLGLCIEVVARLGQSLSLLVDHYGFSLEIWTYRMRLFYHGVDVNLHVV